MYPSTDSAGFLGNVKEVQDDAAKLKTEIDSLKSDIETYSVSKYGEDGFEKDVAPGTSKYQKFQTDKNFYESFLSWRRRFNSLKKDIDSTMVYQGGNADSLAKYKTELPGWRKDFEKLGGKPSIGGTDEGLTLPAILGIIGAAALIGGGAGYYVKKQRSGAMSERTRLYLR